MKRSTKTGIWLIVGGILFALLPIIIVLLGQIPAAIGDCQIDESGTSSCVVWGIEMGGLLSMMLITGWLAFFTFPIGAAVALIGIAVVIVSVIMGVIRRRRNSTSQ